MNIKPSPYFPLRNICLEETSNLISNPLSKPFRKLHKLTGEDDRYFQIIQNPMSLMGIKNKLIRSEYTHIDQWVHDMKLTFANGVTFYGPDSVIGGVAIYFQKKLDKFLNNIQLCNSKNFEEQLKKCCNNIHGLIDHIPDEFGIQTQYILDVGKEKFTLDQFGKIKDDLNALIDRGKTEEIIRIIASNCDFRTSTVKDIDVASLPKAVLLKLEQFIEKNKNLISPEPPEQQK